MENEETIWGGLLRLHDNVEKISKEQKWPELLDMVDGQVFKGFNENTEEDKLFNNESFMMRLCLRYERFKKSDFNIVSIDDKNDRFRICNYDFNTYLWAKKMANEYIDNNCIYVPYKILSKKQIEAFREKAVNNYE